MPIVRVTAEDLRVGDIWLGQSELRVDELLERQDLEVLPWDGPRQSKETAIVSMVRFRAKIIKGEDRGFEGTWSLQPTQPMEVRRG